MEILVPVTAKLSRKFYERLGDDIAGELVDWFNSVDADYQAQLRQTNDLNWERFKSELRAEISGLRAELLKWMFVYWTGTVLTIAGMMLGLATLLRR